MAWVREGGQVTTEQVAYLAGCVVCTGPDALGMFRTSSQRSGCDGWYGLGGRDEPATRTACGRDGRSSRPDHRPRRLRRSIGRGVLRHRQGDAKGGRNAAEWSQETARDRDIRRPPFYRLDARLHYLSGEGVTEAAASMPQIHAWKVSRLADPV